MARKKVQAEGENVIAAVGEVEKQKTKASKPKIITVTGKRKTSVAKATIRDGTGDFRMNKAPLDTYPQLRRLYLIEPIRIAESVIGDQIRKVDVSVNVYGGGSESQTEASRLSIAKALVAFTNNKDLKAAYLKYDRSLLVADVRRKEMRKPGDSKARSRRQTSYR